MRTLQQRAKLVEECCAMAGSNILIAQHRDKLRYEKVRSGSYLPLVRRFNKGDYVYVRQETNSTLQITARPHILHVREVRSSGVLILEGRDGRVMSKHADQCAPCHLPLIDGRVDPAFLDQKDVPCEACGSPYDKAAFLLCDTPGCGKGYHTYCLRPPLAQLPPEEQVWLCPECVAQGITEAEVEEVQKLTEQQLQEMREMPVLFPSAEMARRDLAAEALDGRLVVTTIRDPTTKQDKEIWGRVKYRGDLHRPYYFQVTYQDGEFELVTKRALMASNATRKLQPEGARLPRGVRIPEVVFAASATTVGSTGELPPTWDLTSLPGLTRALTELMPGAHAKNHTSRVANVIQQLRGLAKESIPNNQRFWMETAPKDVEELLKAVDFSGVRSAVEPFCGSGVIANTLTAHGVPVWRNDLNPRWEADSHVDALQPGFYQDLQRKGRCDVIVTSPWFTVLDVAAPLAIRYASKVACLHVPGHWVANPSEPRQEWFKRLQRQGRLHAVMGLPRGPLGRRCAWVLVFASPRDKEEMLKVAHRSSFTVSYV